MDARHGKTTLVVIYGGRSAEHDVSCSTAAHVLRAVDRDRFDTLPLAIDRTGTWHTPQVDVSSERLDASGAPASPADIESAARSGPTVVVPLVHGPYGEDGTLQGLCETLGVPYVGSGVLASAVAMDKSIAKTLCAAHDLPQARHLAFHVDDVDGAVDRVSASLGFPVFVKPANMGSSVGVSKVRDAATLRGAVAEAGRYDEWIVVEEAVEGREIEVAVLGNRSPRASLPGEIVPGHEFYDYEDKYVTDGASLSVPARLTDAQTDEVRRLAVRAYEALRCEGMARVDFFLEEGGRGFLLNEVNTIPGFTPISMYPKLWQATGVSYRDLISELVDLAVERHSRRSRLATR